MRVVKASAGGLDMRPLIGAKTHLAERHCGEEKLRRSRKSRGEDLQPYKCRSVDHQPAHTPGT